MSITVDKWGFVISVKRDDEVSAPVVTEEESEE